MSGQPSPTLADRFHPIASIFPPLEGEAFGILVADIRANGLREPIVEHEGLILDGRNRHGAYIIADVKPRFVQLPEGQDPIAFVLSKNLYRRHLNESQRGMVAARLATMRQGARTDLASKEAMSQPDAAAVMNVGRSTAQRAALVLKKGVAELVRRVEQGEITVATAACVAELPEHEQTTIAEQSEAKLRNAAKAASRAKREQKLSERTTKASQAIGSTLYSVIYADPPWRLEPYSRDTASIARPTITTRRLQRRKFARSSRRRPRTAFCLCGRPRR